MAVCNSRSRIRKGSALPSSTTLAKGPPIPGCTARFRRPIKFEACGTISISVPMLEPSAAFATKIMGMRNSRSYTDAGVPVQVFEMGDGGSAAELHIQIEPGSPPASQGAGAVHHVAFRVPDDGLAYWVDRYDRLGVRSSGAVDRFNFRSLCAREPNGILFEIATDGPGFAADEPQEALRERLSLPPFLEPRRAAIERALKPL